jgi:hypothetical protein
MSFWCGSSPWSLSDAAAAKKAAEAAQAKERVREAERKTKVLEAAIRSDFESYMTLVGFSAAAALALELHDRAGDAERAAALFSETLEGDQEKPVLDLLQGAA